jgi:hypothetical protein
VVQRHVCPSDFNLRQVEVGIHDPFGLIDRPGAFVGERTALDRAPVQRDEDFPRVPLSLSSLALMRSRLGSTRVTIMR